jgi:hypothetical protein
MRSDMLDEELLSLMDRCGNTLKPSKGKKKARSQGSLSWNTCFYQSMRLDEFDEELLSLMDRCGNTLKSSKGRKKVRSQGNLSWNVGFYSGEIWLYTRTSGAEVKILWKRMSSNCQRRNYFPSLEFVGLQRYRWGWCAWWRIVVFWDDFEDEEIDNISYDDKHTLSETYIESSRDESLESDSCW